MKWTVNILRDFLVVKHTVKLYLLVSTFVNRTQCY